MIFDDARDAGDALRIAKAALQRSISHSAATEPSLYSYRDRICTLTEIIQAAKHVAAGLARRTDELSPSSLKRTRNMSATCARRSEPPRRRPSKQP